MLLVDDDETVLKALAFHLGAALPQVRVLTASSAEQALSLAKENRVDLPVVDYDLPDQNGLEVLKALRRHFVKAARILMVGYGDLQPVVGAMDERDFEYFMIKPVDPKELVQLVAAFLKL